LTCPLPREISTVRACEKTCVMKMRATRSRV
jgi:hypothetical protein